MSRDYAKLRNKCNLLAASYEDMEEKYIQLLVVNNILEDEIKTLLEKAENYNIISLNKNDTASQ